MSYNKKSSQEVSFLSRIKHIHFFILTNDEEMYTGKLS